MAQISLPSHAIRRCLCRICGRRGPRSAYPAMLLESVLVAYADDESPSQPTQPSHKKVSLSHMQTTRAQLSLQSHAIRKCLCRICGHREPRSATKPCHKKVSLSHMRTTRAQLSLPSHAIRKCLCRICGQRWPRSAYQAMP